MICRLFSFALQEQVALGSIMQYLMYYLLPAAQQQHSSISRVLVLLVYLLMYLLTGTPKHGPQSIDQTSFQVPTFQAPRLYVVHLHCCTYLCTQYNTSQHACMYVCLWRDRPTQQSATPLRPHYGPIADCRYSQRTLFLQSYITLYVSLI